MYLVKLLNRPADSNLPEFIHLPDLQHYWFVKIPKTKKWLFFSLVNRRKKAEEVTETEAHAKTKAKSYSLRSRKRPKLKKVDYQATYTFTPRRILDFKFSHDIHPQPYYPESHADVRTFLAWHYDKFGVFPQ